MVVGPSANSATAAKRLHRIADGVHIDFDAAERPAGDGDRVPAVFDRAAHLFQAIAKSDVALQAVA